jgi:aryl sulfotransferase
VPLRDYLSVAGDGTRWREFEHRAGDIVVSTPPKCGTTWTQWLIGLLVFDGPDFPDAMSRLSPWLDFEVTDWPELRDRLTDQTHRRILKTHLPLDGLPLHPQVTYVVVGRDPRDVYLSMGDHFANMGSAHQARLLDRYPPDELARRIAATPLPVDFAQALALPAGNCHSAAHPAHVVHHLRTAWDLRHRDNVVLLHYADLTEDLVGELGRLASDLGYRVPADRLAEYAEQGTISAMRARSDELAPDAHLSAWTSNDAFFAAARLGAWRDALSADDLAAYAARVRELSSDDDFLAWLHDGRTAGEPSWSA